MKICSCLLLTLTAASVATPADGAALYLSGYAQTEYGTVNSPSFLANGDPATASTVATSSQTTAPGGVLPNRNSSATYSAYLSLGDLGLSGGVSSYCLSISCGVETSLINLDEFTQDVLTLPGVSSGTVGLNFSVDGTFSGSSNNPQDYVMAVYRIGSNNITNSTLTAVTAFGALGSLSSQNGPVANYGSTISFSFTQDPTNPTLWDYAASGSHASFHRRFPESDQ